MTSGHSDRRSAAPGSEFLRRYTYAVIDGSLETAFKFPLKERSASAGCRGGLKY